MRKKSIAQHSEPDGEIDLTPMLDVVFIMLIFFIVTATFIKEPGIDVNRPIALTGDAVTNQKILIAINPEGEVWLDRKKLKDHQIRTEIEKMHSESPNGAVVIQADQLATAEKVAMVIDAAKKVGVKDITLATLK